MTSINSTDIPIRQRPSAAFEAEWGLIRRLFRLLLGMMILWFLMLYLLAHNDDRLVIAGLVCLCLWIVYMCSRILGTICCANGGNQQRIGPANSGDDEEEEADQAESRGLTAAGGESGMGGTINHDGSTFSYPVEETSQRIRSCNQLVTPGKSPMNGTYSAVYNAIVFHRTIRSEGKLRLQFHTDHKHDNSNYTSNINNGWTITGESVFGSDSRPIEDGFVNAKGEMYWKVGSTIYRGVLDLNSSCLFDGEFMPASSTAKSIMTAVKPPHGRIVRLELSKAAFYTGSSSSYLGSSDVEMITFSSTADETQEDASKNPEPLLAFP